MIITQKLQKPITETAYLTADRNVHRYRVIIRYFYEQYEKIQYWLYPQEVFDVMKDQPGFEEYTLEECKRDFEALRGWKNLNALQDSRKAQTIEAFKNKEFRYQLTEYTVEIERMTIKLENLFVEGASLEPGLLERIRMQIHETRERSLQTQEEVFSWWQNLNSDFVRLNQEYQDYVRLLSSAKAEEMLKTQSFLLYKDRLIEILRNFIKALQKNAPAIEEDLKGIEEQTVERFLQKLVAYRSATALPMMEADEAAVEELQRGRWLSLRNWFVAEEGRVDEASRLFEMTNEIIRRMTRYASQLSEFAGDRSGRKDAYRRMAWGFSLCRSIEEAHKLSARVFGIERLLHLQTDEERETESANSSVYDENPLEFPLSSRSRTLKERMQQRSIREHKEEKQQILQEQLQRAWEEERILEELMKDGQIDFGNLALLERSTRRTLLRWLSKGLIQPGKMGSTLSGKSFRVRQSQDQPRCILRCEDGDLAMPRFILEFEGEGYERI